MAVTVVISHFQEKEVSNYGNLFKRIELLKFIYRIVHEKATVSNSIISARSLVRKREQEKQHKKHGF